MAAVDRRAFLSLIPAGAIAGPVALRGFARWAPPSALHDRFHAIPSQLISPGTRAIRTLGYAAPGDGGMRHTSATTSPPPPSPHWPRCSARIAAVAAVDSAVHIGLTNIATRDADIEQLTVTADRSDVPNALLFIAGSKDQHGRTTGNNHIVTVSLAQSPAARAAGRVVANPVGWSSELDADNAVDTIAGIARQPFRRSPTDAGHSGPRFGSMRISVPGQR